MKTISFALANVTVEMLSRYFALRNLARFDRFPDKHLLILTYPVKKCQGVINLEIMARRYSQSTNRKFKVSRLLDFESR